MVDIKEYTWAFPIAGGVIALIAFLTPAGYFSSGGNSIYNWMWGLFSVQYYGYGGIVRFTVDIGEIIVCLIGSLIVLASIGMIISRGNKLKKGIDDRSWVNPSVGLMLGTIIWIVGLEINSQVFYGISMWSMLNPGFGVIGMFLGGIVALVGHGVSKMSPKQAREVIMPMKKLPTPDQAYGQPSEAAEFKFCPNCGTKIINANNRFCTICGFELQNIPI